MAASGRACPRCRELLTAKELAGAVPHDCPKRKPPKRSKGDEAHEARAIADGAVMRALAEDELITEADEEELEAC